MVCFPDYFKTLWMCVESCQIDKCVIVFFYVSPKLVLKNDALAADPFNHFVV